MSEKKKQVSKSKPIKLSDFMAAKSAEEIAIDIRFPHPDPAEDEVCLTFYFDGGEARKDLSELRRRMGANLLSRDQDPVTWFGKRCWLDGRGVDGIDPESYNGAAVRSFWLNPRNEEPNDWWKQAVEGLVGYITPRSATGNS